MQTNARADAPVRAMLEMDTAARGLDPAAVAAPGGFGWWYAEVGDDQGNGLVLIWSFGLPFLPGYQAAALAGKAPPARERPSLNVAVYRGGEAVAYALHEFAADAAHWQPRDADGVERWRFGATRIASRRSPGGPSSAGMIEVDADLDLPIAGGGTLRGTARLQGPAAVWSGALAPSGRAGDAAGDAPSHRWTPICGAAFGTGRLQCGPLRFSIAGRAYHDRNAAPWPLASLGIARWLWGRAALPDRDRVFYGLWPDDGGEPAVLGIDLHADGRLEAVGDLALTLDRPHRTRWRMPSADRIRVHKRGQPTPWLELDARHAVDDGPFYLRRLCAAASDAATGTLHGTFEIICPDRIDQPLLRPLVRMRVARGGAGDSFWLPLFEGARDDRLRRLLRRRAAGGAA